MVWLRFAFKDKSGEPFKPYNRNQLPASARPAIQPVVQAA
jgi:hypothetical protein